MVMQLICFILVRMQRTVIAVLASTYNHQYMHAHLMPIPPYVLRRAWARRRRA